MFTPLKVIRSTVCLVVSQSIVIKNTTLFLSWGLTTWILESPTINTHLKLIQVIDSSSSKKVTYYVDVDFWEHSLKRIKLKSHIQTISSCIWGNHWTKFHFYLISRTLSAVEKWKVEALTQKEQLHCYIGLAKFKLKR